jgi:hypothetical protein
VILATPYNSARAALVARGENKAAILLDGMPVVIHEDDADELAAEGVEFAYFAQRPGNDRIFTIPVN